MANFTLPATARSTTVAVSSFSATDAIGVTGYLITESSSAPLATAAGWSGTAPTSFTFSGTGSRTAYGWAKDGAGNVSNSGSATVVIILVVNSTTAGTITVVPGSTTSLVVTAPYAGDNNGNNSLTVEHN